MAESNQRKIADPIELNDDDPFAELTRIMGFDPRLGVGSLAKAADSTAPAAAVQTPRPVIAPVIAQSAAIQPAAAVDPVLHDDFGIDLEKELMGEFADFEAAPEAAPSVAAAPELYRESAPELYAAPVDAELDDEFHDAFTASFDDGMPAVESAEPQSSTVEPEVARPHGSYEPAASTESDALELELDLAPDFELELAPEPELELEPEPQLELAPEPELELAPEPELELAPEFELELAPDFELDLTPESELELASEPPKSELAAEPDLDVVPEFELDDLDLSEPLDDVNPIEAAAPCFEDEPAYGDEVEEYADEVLDEVSDAQMLAPEAAAVPRDGLAEVDMDFTGAFDRAVETEQDANDAPDLVSSGDPWAVEPEHQVEQVQQPAASDPLTVSLEDELDALLNAHPQPVRQAQATVVGIAPEPAWQSAYPADARWAALEDEEEEVAQEVAPPAAPSVAASEPRRPFINPALISRHANFKVAAPTVAAPAKVVEEPHDDLDDLLAAMESEVHATDHSPASAKVAPAYDPLTGEFFGAGHGHADSEPAVAEPTNSAADYVRHDDETLPARPAYDTAPDIETIDVPETAVAMADDLDIPELAYEEDVPAGQVFDDIDADFAAAYGETSLSEEPAGQPVKSAGRATADFESLYRSSAVYPASSAYAAATVDGNTVAPTATADFDDGAPFDNFEVEATKTPLAGDRDRFVDLDFDSDVEEEMTVPAYAQQQRVTPRQRRGVMIAAIVGGVALLGGVGALALTFGDGKGADVPVVVKADDGPVKIKPENPGGTTVPNQDNKVYDAVKGASATSTAPAQEKLVTTSEEPVDMAAVDKADTTELPGLADVEDIIAEDRVDPLAGGDQSMNAPEAVIVTPRKVKTMVVRSDGTLVAREDPTSAAPAEPVIADTATAAAPLQPTEQASADGDETAAVTTDPVTTDKTASDNKLQPAFQSPGSEEAVAVKPVKSKKVEGTVAPEAGPVAPPVPTEKPADVASEVKPEQLATANIEPAAIASGAWSVQIASQPSAESANANYQDLARRYAGVIGGRGVNIVKAEITGKGTYWRVRVPAKSRDDAINLCNDYKAAGGNCFVSK